MEAGELLAILCARELLTDLGLKQRKLLQGSVDLTVDEDEILLLGGQGGLQVGNLLRESLGRACDALGIEAEDSVAGIDQVGDGGGEFCGETGGRRLQERLHVGGLVGEGGGELRGVDGKRAVVVEVDAETG